MSLEVYLSPLQFPLDVKVRVLFGGMKYIINSLSNRRPTLSAKSRPRIPINDLREALLKVGVTPDSNIFVHSGIGNIGIIEGGRKKVFETLLELIDIERSNILFPVFSYTPTVLKYLKSNPVFDVKKSPSYMGSLTQYALKSGMGKRSLHPTHSVLAIGRDEEWLTNTHHLDIYPFATKSPFYKHLKLKKPRILLLGVDMESVTAIHVIEDLLKRKFPVKVYLDRVFRVRCVDYNGKTFTVKTRAHTPFIHLARKTGRFWNILRLQNAISGHVKIGLSSITLIDAKKFHEILKKYAMRGITVYGDAV